MANSNNRSAGSFQRYSAALGVTLRVWKRKASGYWYYAIRSGPEARRKSRPVSLHVRNRPDAEAAIDRLEAEWAAVKSGASPATMTTASYAEAAAAFLEAKRGQVRASSHARYCGTMKVFGEHVGSVLLTAITAREIEGFPAWRIASGFTRKTAYVDMQTLKHFFAWAADRGYLSHDPSARVRNPKPPDVDAACYTDKEADALCTDPESPEWLRRVFVVLRFTGLRISELLSLRGEDVRWDDASRRSGQLVVRAREGYSPKSGRSRSLPILPPVAEVLRACSVQGPEPVFPGPKGGNLKETRLLELLKRSRRRLAIPAGTLHTFRHWFVSWLVRNGMTETVVKKWVGHGSHRMVSHYVHLHDSASREMAARLPVWTRESAGGSPHTPDESRRESVNSEAMEVKQAG